MNPENDPGIALVPHTHWDREWYEPFQVFRFKLVQMFDAVLATAEADPRFRFTLDGQTAAIEDYLEVRPENEKRVRDMVARGQLALGPWQILLDEFLCSGETIVRNLQMGMAGADALGGHMDVGYLPDMFGHVAQMPQILRRAGIRHACLWRGVPSSVTEHAFRWEAPDGSAVRTEYLFDGYGSALDILAIPEHIPQNIAQYRQDTDTRYHGEQILGMVGTDHMAPDPRLMEHVRRFDGVHGPIAVNTLEEYLGQFDPEAPLATVRGELRSHHRGNILPGVFSIRRNLKIAMARAERTVLDAERLAAEHGQQGLDPYFRMSWRRIIESTAHDSVVGSGTDETVEQVEARLQEAAQIARAVRDDVGRSLAVKVPSDSYVAVNTLTTDRTMTVELQVPAPDPAAAVLAETADGARLPVQEIGEAPTLLGDESMDSGVLVERMLNRIHGRELFGQLIDGYRVSPHGVEFDVAEVPSSEQFDVAVFRTELEAAVEQHPGDWKVRIQAQPRRKVLVSVPVAAMGTTPFRVFQGPARPEREGTRVQGRVLHNGLVSAEVLDDGTVNLTGQDGTVLRGIGRLVDGGDRGDSYNYGPPAADLLVEEPEETEVRILESGPVRALAVVSRTYRWPVGLGTDRDLRSTETAEVRTSTFVELRQGEPFVRLRVQFTNAAADHRLRLHIPLPEAVTSSASEGQFSVTTRGLTAEGGGGEFPLPTFPAYSFVSAGPATVLVREATEYEVVDGKELALTLVRAVGSISVNVHPLRDEPAASEIPIPGGQEPGTLVDVELAVGASSRGYKDAGAVRQAEQFNAEPLVFRGTAERNSALPEPGRGLRVTGTDVAVTSLRPVGPAVEARVVLLSDTAGDVVLEGAFSSVATVDLRGEEIAAERAAGRYRFTLEPWEIRTLRLTT